MNNEFVRSRDKDVNLWFQVYNLKLDEATKKPSIAALALVYWSRSLTSLRAEVRVGHVPGYSLKSRLAHLKWGLSIGAVAPHDTHARVKDQLRVGAANSGER